MDASPAPTTPGGGRRRHGERYLSQFKNRVIAAYVENKSFVKTAREFQVHHTTVSQWVREERRKVQYAPTPPMVLAAATPPPPTPAEEVLASTSHGDDGLDYFDPPATIEMPRAPEERFRVWLESQCYAQTMVTREDVIARAKEALHVSSEVPPGWLRVWAGRLEDRSPDNKTHLTYPGWFKRVACTLAKLLDTSTSARILGVSRKRVGEWITQGDKVEESKPRGGGEGRAITSAIVEEQLLQWVKKEFQGAPLKGAVVRRKAIEMYKAAGHELACSKGWFARWSRRHGLESNTRVSLDQHLESKLVHWTLAALDRHELMNHSILRERATAMGRETAGPEFSVSPSWVIRFLHRHAKLLQSRPDIDEPSFPQLMQQQAMDFRVGLENMFFLGCMDEIALTFPSPLQGVERPVEALRGGGLTSGTLLPRCTADQSQAILILAALEDGRLLPPALILKEGEDEARGCPEVAKGLVHIIQQPAFSSGLDPVGLQYWVDDVWFRYVPVPNALVVDSLPAHDDLGVRRAMAQVSCHLAVMPDGCSILLQPLVRGGLVAWVLENLQERWARHVSNQPLPGRPLTPHCTDLVRWLAEIYTVGQGTAQQEMIREGFKTSGLRPKTIFPPPS